MRERRDALSDRLARLQQLSLALAEAIRPSEFAAVVVDQCLGAFGANAGFVASLDPNTNELEVIVSSGYPSYLVSTADRLQLSDDYVICDAVRTGRPVFLESLQDILTRYPALAGLQEDTGLQAVAAVPLVVKERIIGGLVISFMQQRRFSRADKGFIAAIASHCAQALERSRVYEQEQLAMQRLHRLQALSASIVRSLTVDEVAEAMIQQAHDAIGASSSVIYSRDDETEQMRMVAARALPEAMIAQFRWIGEELDVPLATAIRTGECLWFENREQLDKRIPAALVAQLPRRKVQALIALPLRIDEQVVGGLMFAFDRPRRFSSMDREFLDALGRHCAQALQRARLYEREQRAHERERKARAEAEAARQHMGFLAEVSHTLASSLEFEVTFAAVARLAVAELADLCIIAVEGQDGSLMHPGFAHRNAALEQFVGEAFRGFAYNPDTPPTIVRVWQTGVPVLIPELSLEQGLEVAQSAAQREALHALALRSILAVPLVARGRTMGVLYLARSAQGARFTSEDQGFAEELARRAALALDNARLFRERDRQLGRMHVLAEASRLFAELHLDVQVIAQRLVERVLRHLGDGCSVRLLSTDGLRLETRAWDTAKLELRETLGESMTRGMRVSEGLIGQVYQSGKSLLWPRIDWKAYPGQSPAERRSLTERYGLASMVAAPMRVGSRVIGVVNVVRGLDTPELFTEEDAILLQELADRAALAIAAAQEHDALELEKERYRTLIQATAQVVWTTDARGMTVEDSPSWRALTSQDWEEYRGAGWLDVVHPEDRERCQAAWLEAVAERRPYEQEMRVRRHDGQYMYVLARAAPVFNPDGTVREWIGITSDISARKQAEDSLREANRRKDEFLAMLGHELRNPLAPIMTALELMKLGDEAKAERACAVIERQVQHVNRLVDDLLDVSRITRGKIELKKEPVELSAIVGKAIEMASPLLEQRNHHLTVDVPRDGTMLLVDPTRFAQVLANLLTNAAKYTMPGGWIRIGAERRDGNVHISVKDSGIGFPPEVIPRLFEPFYQAERRVDRSHGGLGLGLALVKNLVELHGGLVTARSKGTGQGSEFTVQLPAAAVTTAPAERIMARQTGRPVIDPSAARRILVVDDNPDAADTLADMLRCTGHHVSVAYDGPQALSLSRNFPFDVALLDIGLPVMDGYELARRLREQVTDRPVRFIALTGYGQEEDRARSRAAGFAAHFTKPVRLDAIEAAVMDPGEDAP